MVAQRRKVAATSGESRFNAVSELRNRNSGDQCLFFVFDLDAKGFEELEILLAYLEFGIGRQSGNQ